MKFLNKFGPQCETKKSKLGPKVKPVCKIWTQFATRRMKKVPGIWKYPPPTGSKQQGYCPPPPL